jgi:hypothetical protein
MKMELTDIVSFPARITKFSWVQPDLETFIIRLPNSDMVKESIQQMKDNGDTTYPALSEYARKICLHDPDISNLDFLYTRIADYTIAQCK